MQTISIHGSDEVMAPFGEIGIFLQGKRQVVRIVEVGPDESTPLEVRQALVGKVLCAIFTREQVVGQGGPGFIGVLPEGCLLCYAQEVIEMLEASQEIPAAKALKGIVDNALDMYILERGTYELVP